ncbi:MAG TPA: alpha/beta fold hydrolase [Chloroflexota bacterium]|nr:alpha/beta fold hydrolase [Chloroflexota bacterium]
MPLVDLPLPQLQEYRPSPTREPDFDAFWEGTLAEASRIPLEIEVEPVADYPVPGLRLARVRYSGWAGSRICAWWLVPPEAAPGARDGRRPAMVFYHGYGGSKGGADLYLGWALQGYCVLAVDTRGQSGESSDPKPYPGGHATGYMTQGVLSPADYYYRGAYVDCLRALDVLGAQPEVDPSRIGLTGVSQGGALTLAVAALDPQRRARLAMPDVPYLCHFRRAVDVASVPPYTEIAGYCRTWPQREGEVFRTLSYFDNMNLAPRVTCPVLISVGLQDVCCPPSTIFAAYNHLGSAEQEKEIKVFPYNGHEGSPTHVLDKLRWARRLVFDA